MVVVVDKLIISHDDYFLKRVIDFQERKTFLPPFLVRVHLVGRLDIIPP